MNRMRITSCQAPSANLFHHQWVQHRFAIVLSTGIAKISSALELQETLSVLVEPIHDASCQWTCHSVTLHILHLFTLYLDVDITSLRQVPGSSTMMDQFAKILFHPMAVSGIWLFAFGETIRASLNSFAVSCPEAQQVKEQLPPAQEKSKSNPIETGKSFCENSKNLSTLCVTSGHNLASLLQTTLSPKQALPVLQMHWTNYVVNLEPMALWTAEQQCWAFRNGPSSILEGSSDIAREGYHGMVATRRMPYVSIRWFHHWGAVQFQTNDLGNCDIDSQKVTRLNRIRWFTKLFRGKTSKKSKRFAKCQWFFRLSWRRHNLAAFQSSASEPAHFACNLKFELTL